MFRLHKDRDEEPGNREIDKHLQPWEDHQSLPSSQPLHHPRDSSQWPPRVEVEDGMKEPWVGGGGTQKTGFFF